MTTRDMFDNISPIDYRYWDEEVAWYLSENGSTRYKLMMEIALIKALHRRGVCSSSVVHEVSTACKKITTAEVYEEEKRIRHDIRALVNCICAHVSDEAKPYVHMTATSFDIIDSANALRYRDVVQKIMLPCLIKLEHVLIDMVLRETDTIQVGRTHGQHAVPITFGFALAEYVNRLGDCILNLKRLTGELRGKFSGAVGAYNASSLFFDDPEEFEKEVLAEVGLLPTQYSTQIAPPEALVRVVSEVVLIAGVLANLSRDMRSLQRTEIAEVGEEFEADRVGSSTMPQKRNPIDFENAESMWKIVMARIITVMIDQISEHQRDLTNSASGKTYGEIFAYVVAMAKRFERTMKRIIVDHTNLSRNLDMQKGLILAEPLQLMLSALGHPHAYEKVRLLTIQAQAQYKSLEEIVVTDNDIQSYVNLMTPHGREVLSTPTLYTGIAAKKARAVAEHWKKEFGS